MMAQTIHSPTLEDAMVEAGLPLPPSGEIKAEAA
jgi:hypothetical protein